MKQALEKNKRFVASLIVMSATLIMLAGGLFETKAQTSKSQGFNRFIEQTQNDFDQFVSEMDDDYASFLQRMNRDWDSFIQSTSKDWASFSDNGSTRSFAEFDKGKLTIETRLRNHEHGSDPDVLRRMESHFDKIRRKTQWKKSGYEFNPLAVSFNQRTLDSAFDKSFIDKRMNKQPSGQQSPSVRSESYTSKNGNRHRKLSIAIPMVPNHVEKRAEVYLPLVQKNAERFAIPVPLILAIMKAESSFNPYANSNIAFGLMQLVPHSGGREGHRVAFGYPRVLAPDSLFDPELNITLGTAYLHRLRYHYFAPVNSREKNIYLIISAYNTGQNNVARTFAYHENIDTQFRMALDIIQSLPPDALYRKLLRGLPYSETRRYLPRVVRFMKNYSQY